MLKVPFGMLFAERVDQITQDTQTPEYDETEQISFVTDASGVRVPFVSECLTIPGTVTFTKVRAEESDTDYTYAHMSGTESFTFVRTETTDTDPTDDRSDLGTATKVRAEEEYTLF